MPKARRFGGVPGRCVEKKPIKTAVFFGVIKGRRKFFWGRGCHAVVRRFFCCMGWCLQRVELYPPSDVFRRGA